MNRTVHSLIAFLSIVAAIVVLGLAAAVLSYLGCPGQTSGELANAMAALTVLAGVFRPSSTNQGGPSDGTTQAPV